VIHRKLLRRRHVRKEQIMRMRETSSRERENESLKGSHQNSLEALNQSTNESISQVTTLQAQSLIHVDLSETKEPLLLPHNTMTHGCGLSIEAMVTEHSFSTGGGTCSGKDGLGMLVECLNN
jgi:hypothetical protein